MKQLSVIFGSEAYLRNCFPHKLHSFFEQNGSYNSFIIHPKGKLSYFQGNPFIFLLKSESTIEEDEKQATECKSDKFQGWVTTTW